MNTRWQCWRNAHQWAIGWQSGRWWLSPCGWDEATVLDLGTWRIRWARPDFRPLFSERYGYTPVHKFGRLALIHSPRRKKKR